MKRIAINSVSVLLVVSLVFGITTVAKSAKPQKAIEMSNGMPSGEHETLLIHGKKGGYQCEECEICTTCDPPVQCNVINMPEYGTATIKYVSGKKVKIGELIVFDSYASWEGSDPPVDDPAEVWLPYEQEGYWVFMRALGKPGKGAEERYVMFENESLEAYTLLVDEVSSPDDIVIGLGLLTNQGTWLLDASGELYRFDGDSDQGKGKSQGRDFTDMFMFSGFVFHPDLDVNLDGVVNELDVIADSCPWDADQSGTIDTAEVDAWALDHADDPVNGDDVNGDGNVNELDVIMDSCPYDDRINDGVISWDEDYDEGTFPDCEFEDWLADNSTNAEGEPLWAYYDEEWIFTIADLVYLNQVVTNEGIKNVQIRFYPKATTEFVTD
jgi:hypothetical protein